MDFLIQAKITVPLSHLVLYIAVVAFCLLFSRIQLGLAVTFVFVFYLGYVHNYSFIMDMIQGSALATILYFASGVLLLGLSIISFFQRND